MASGHVPILAKITEGLMGAICESWFSKKFYQQGRLQKRLKAILGTSDTIIYFEFGIKSYLLSRSSGGV